MAAYVSANGVREVYITLPLGSQPRIVELLEQVQGTTASVFFVPDVFGISIIQGRLQDMNGIPVVGICETPFTGTNRLIKRISDIVLALDCAATEYFADGRYDLAGEEISLSPEEMARYLADLCNERGIHCTVYATGCIRRRLARIRRHRRQGRLAGQRLRRRGRDMAGLR